MSQSFVSQEDESVPFSSRDINLYLQSFESGYGRDSRVGILIEANVLKDNQGYLVCANLKKDIIGSAKLRKRKSDRLNPEGATPTNFDNTTLTVVFADKENNVQEEHTIYNNEPVTTFDDDAEEMRQEKKTRIGHRRKFPQDLLNIGYKKRSYDLSFRRQQNHTNEVSKQILASCIERK